MKRTIKSLFFVALFALAGFATANAQLGIHAGYVNSAMKGDVANSDSFNGFQVGLDYNMPIMGGFSLQYALDYTMLTKKYNVLVDITSTGHYLNVPVRAAYTYYFGPDFGIFAYGGPNFAIGVAGKDKASTSGGGVSVEGNDWFSGDNARYKRFDVMLGLGGGIQYQNITLKAGYDWGLLNLSKISNFDINRNQFNVTLGYFF